MSQTHTPFRLGNKCLFWADASAGSELVQPADHVIVCLHFYGYESHRRGTSLSQRILTVFKFQALRDTAMADFSNSEKVSLLALHAYIVGVP